MRFLFISDGNIVASQKESFTSYLESKYPERYSELLVKFEKYHAWLVEINQHINLISRKMDTEDYWTLHFLDVLLLEEVTQIEGERVLDFGTGGGLPGVPMAILYPETMFYLMDSKRKKLNVIADACEILELDNVELVHARAEEAVDHFSSSFDIILSRSVRITPELKKVLAEMVIPKGKMYLYKSVQLDDIVQFKKKNVHDVSRNELGTRHIVEIFC